MSARDLERKHLKSSSLGTLKKRVKKTSRNLKLTRMTKDPGPLPPGVRSSGRVVSLGIVMATALSVFIGSGVAATPQPISLEVPLRYPEHVPADQRSPVVLALYPPEISGLGEGYASWYRLQIKMKPALAKQFPRVRDTGEGWFLSLEDPGCIVLAVEDAKAYFGSPVYASGHIAYYKQTKGLSENPKDTYSQTLGKKYEPSKKAEFTLDEKQKAKLEFLLGLTKVGPYYGAFKLAKKLGEDEYEYDWALTTKAPALSDPCGATSPGVYEFSSHNESRKPQPEFTEEGDSICDFQSLAWERMCTGEEAVSLDQGYEINYCFHLKRQSSDLTCLWIRAVIPYRWIGGTLYHQAEDVRHVEIEWQVTLPQTQ